MLQEELAFPDIHKNQLHHPEEFFLPAANDGLHQCLIDPVPLAQHSPILPCTPQRHLPGSLNLEPAWPATQFIDSCLFVLVASRATSGAISQLTKVA